jgi:hypothetical protein
MNDSDFREREALPTLLYNILTAVFGSWVVMNENVYS